MSTDARSTPPATVAAATLLSLLFLFSGAWKLSDLDATAERMIQTLIPAALSMPAAVAVAVAEVFAAVLLLMPRYRRWGAWLAGLMLLAFMIYVGALYDRLLGEDCNCFPWIRRVVGPAFFAGDAAMLLLSALAAWRAPVPAGLRQPAAILLGIAVIAAGSYAVSAARRGSADVPESTLVNGQPVPLREGRVVLYFFDPECTHCLGVAREMARRDWTGTRLIALATREQRFACGFIAKTGLPAGIADNAETLIRAIAFADPPFAVAIEDGRLTATFNSGQLESEEFFAALERSGHIRNYEPRDLD